MELREIVHDLLLISSRSKITDDFRLSKRYMEYKIREYRARGIREAFGRNKQIEPIWLQDFGNADFTQVDAAEDSTVTICDCKFGKFTVPSVVSLKKSQNTDYGIYKVLSACKTKEYHPTTMDRLRNHPPDSIYSKFNFYFRIGNAIYTAPFSEKLNLVLILENPLDGFVIQTENIKSGDLIVGDSYTVISGDIIHDSNPFDAASNPVFVAVNKTFTGSGIVQFTNQKRKFNNRDPYPMSHTLMEYVILKILTQDLRIEETRIADVRNDARDELQTLQQEQKVA